VRIRRFMAEADWLDPAPLARSAGALADANEALDFATRSLAEAHMRQGGGVVTLLQAGLPDEIVRRLLLKALKAVAADAAPRGKQVTDLMLRLRAGGTATLAGVKCIGGDVWRFEAAPVHRS
jgi:tRNA(Ile)-lysidine synthase